MASDNDDTPVEVPVFAGGTPVKRIAVAELAFADADKKGVCHFCKSVTSRTIAHRGYGDQAWLFIYSCDYCSKTLREMPFEPKEF